MSFWLSYHNAWTIAFYLALGKISITGKKFYTSFTPSIETGFSTIVCVSFNILSPLNYFGLISYLFI